MAFRHSTYHPPQRIYTAPEETHHPASTPPQSQPLEESTEWILFSPVAPSVTDRTYTTSTDRTRTAGHSRISDFGSLAARSYDDRSEDAIEEEEEEDGELDSLDSHLHEFRTEPSVYREGAERSGTVLPTHDGLGSFRIDQTAMGEEVQAHLYAFERFNPRRMSVKRRREEELGLPFEESERAAEAERTRRIEAWRMEQSRLLVDEIQRETRRRKESMSSERRVSIVEREQEDVATLSNVEGSVHEEPEENESFWNRITKRVIRDLMGIDDDLLSIIFGESLPADDDLSTTPRADSPLKAVVAASQYDESSWEYRLLERIARELGILVNQISDHPGAFSTYLQTQQTPLPYAGLPVIPETNQTAPSHPPPTSSLQTTSFLPTLQTQPLAIPASTMSLASPILPENDATPRQNLILTREDWERDLDIKMVFRYLRSRFTSLGPSLPTTHGLSSFAAGTGTSHLATASTADTAARAARVRAHHPLVTRHPTPRLRTWRASVPGKEGVARRGSSCASESAKSRVGYRRNSGSSRHYWDFGHGTGSVGSGSMIASTGGMGSWGEV